MHFYQTQIQDLFVLSGILLEEISGNCVEKLYI